MTTEIAGPSCPIDLRDSSFFVDPYPTFARLRESRPVFWSEQWKRWVLTRHDDIVAVLRDTRRFSSDVLPQLGTADEKIEMAPFLRAMPRWLFFLDPPIHIAARAPYAAPFTPAALLDVQPVIQRVADELLDRVADAGSMDAIWDFAFPLPATVLAELLCPPEDRSALVDRARSLAWASAHTGDPEARRTGISASAALADYFTKLIAQRRIRRPGPLLARFIIGLEQRASLDEQDLCAQCLLMLCAGNETTQHVIGNSLMALLGHPVQLEQFRERAEEVPGAIDELLRFDSAVQSVNRIARTEVVMHGQTIAAGDELVLLIAAANRDPARFHDPDQLDLQRADVQHLSFGLGPHYCLGASLARMEAAIALRTLLSRFGHLKLSAAPAVWRDHDPALRGLRTFPVEW